MLARRQRLRRLLFRAILVAVVFVILVGAAGYLVITREVSRSPDWWRPPSSTDPATLESARAVENGVTTVLHQQRPDDAAWTMLLTESDVNAWLAARLKNWVRNQRDDFVWPSEVKEVLIHLEPGVLRVGIEIERRGAVIICSASLTPRVDEDGSLWISATAFHIGTLPVPARWALRAAESPLREVMPTSIGDSPESGSILSALLGAGALSREPVLRLSDGRRVRIVEIRVEEGRLLVTCRSVRTTSPR